MYLCYQKKRSLCSYLHILTTNIKNDKKLLKSSTEHKNLKFYDAIAKQLSMKIFCTFRNKIINNHSTFMRQQPRHSWSSCCCPYTSIIIIINIFLVISLLRLLHDPSPVHSTIQQQSRNLYRCRNANCYYMH